MPVMYNTGDWFSLRPGNTYRKIELYNIQWPSNIDLDYMKVCCAPFGGPIALITDPKSIVPHQDSTKQEIKICNSVGTQIGKIKWKNGNLLAMGWSDTEELLCVQDDALVIIYDMFGNEKHTFSMGDEGNSIKVIEAKIFASAAGTGVAVLTTKFRVSFVNNIKEPTRRTMPEIPKSIRNPTSWSCWEIITEDRNTYCLVGRDKEILKLVMGQTVCGTHTSLIERPFETIIKMSVSFNHRFLALYTNNGIIWLGTSDMKKKFCEFDTGRSENPRQIEWILDSENCSQSDAVIITYPSLLLVINLNGDQNMFTYDPAIFLIPEIDGVRILTNTVHEMIQKVPKCVQNIFAINSQEPSSFLFEAQKKFQEKSHQSDEYLGLIKDKMLIAVNECIEAAGYEFDTSTQKSLIKTAYFGKGFIPSHQPDAYIKIIKILRVLNALRHPNVALPLTYQQFTELKPLVVLDRLVFRKHYTIAVHMAKHLKLPESRILEHWAIHKIKYDKNNEEVAKKITQKFKNTTIKGLSFSKIAEEAYLEGRDSLAISFIELEPKASLQVPLLLKLKKHDIAIKSATKSGDTDLMYTILLNLAKIEQRKLLILIREQYMARNLYIKYCKLYKKSIVQDIYNENDLFKYKAEFELREGIEMKNIDVALPLASTEYNKGEHMVEFELCNDTRKIITQQNDLTKKYGKVNGFVFNGLSINDTVEAVMKIGDMKLTDKLKNEYKIPDRRFWWIKIRVLSQQFRWDELEKFSKTKKSPIGYEPFVEVCLQQHKIDESKKYLVKCRDDKKVKLYIKAGLLKDASNIAFEQRDKNSLEIIRKKISIDNNDSTLLEHVNSLIEQLLRGK